MVSVKKSKLKKVLIIIIIAILLFSAVSFTATKLIYDSVFPRYDCAISDYPIALESTVSSREKVSYPSGENLLSGYLYKSTPSSIKYKYYFSASMYSMPEATSINVATLSLSE